MQGHLLNVSRSNLLAVDGLAQESVLYACLCGQANTITSVVFVHHQSVHPSRKELHVLIIQSCESATGATCTCTPKAMYA